MMKVLGYLALTGLVFVGALNSVFAEEWQTPRITGYGKVRPYSDTAVYPEASGDYKILFDITKAADAPGQINPGFEHVARLLNLFALAKVPEDRIKVVLVVHGSATPAVLDKTYYRKQFGIVNPNAQLITQLAEAGVTLYVCGQALAQYHYPLDWINGDITLALAALTVLPAYQRQGYSLIPQ
ncbi:DsrE family protein [Nitrosococcus wardiae]|uniref:Sulfur reduction protein DsrE n=1 Tax=Nitrosococcus wardiae TaxID=1814290 RepID=A0A4P7C1M5_9GAMM|nr:DsrE family protein [Nitrosococcus wardiae]QBQ55520.1 sulfur reduction protein DsrE [Nitrosococcus wardiae]